MCYLIRKILNLKMNKVNTDLPQDIIREINLKFLKSDVSSIIDLCLKVKGDSLNVGSDQLIRCMIILSDGDKVKMEEIRESKYWGDPRDVINSANNKLSDCNYGLSEFGVIS